MKIEDLRGICVDDICVYKEKSVFDYEDVYSGTLEDMPMEILDSEIRLIGGKNKNTIDIKI